MPYQSIEELRAKIIKQIAAKPSLQFVFDRSSDTAVELLNFSAISLIMAILRGNWFAFNTHREKEDVQAFDETTFLLYSVLPTIAAILSVVKHQFPEKDIKGLIKIFHNILQSLWSFGFSLRAIQYLGGAFIYYVLNGPEYFYGGKAITLFSLFFTLSLIAPSKPLLMSSIEKKWPVETSRLSRTYNTVASSLNNASNGKTEAGFVSFYLALMHATTTAPQEVVMTMFIILLRVLVGLHRMFCSVEGTDRYEQPNRTDPLPKFRPNAEYCVIALLLLYPLAMEIRSTVTSSSSMIACASIALAALMLKPIIMATEKIYSSCFNQCFHKSVASEHDSLLPTTITPQPETPQ